MIVEITVGSGAVRSAWPIRKKRCPENEVEEDGEVGDS